MKPVIWPEAALQHVLNPAPPGRRSCRLPAEGARRVAVAQGLAVAAVVLSLLGSCTSLFAPPVPAPAEVRESALSEAVRYIGMEYEWGGQDIAPRGIDCSGLVVNVYHYAAAVHGCETPFRDATAAGFREDHTVPVDIPAPGDLIFMGEPADVDSMSSDEARAVTHVAIFEAQASGMITFIDSTLIPDLGINGVSRRSFEAGDPRIIGYGRVLLRL